VSDDDEGDAVFAIEVEENVFDDSTGGGIEVSGWLIGKDDSRVVDESAGDNRALLLASRQVHRLVAGLVCHLKLLECGEGALFAFASFDPGYLHRQHHVFENGRVGGEEELLEDEPERLIACPVEVRAL